MHKRTTASEVSNGFGVLAPFLVLDAYQVVSLVLAYFFSNFFKFYR
jgi:hypothetical protein